MWNHYKIDWPNFSTIRTWHTRRWKNTDRIFFKLVERMRKNRGDDRGDRACGRKLRQNNSRKTRANETDAQQKGRQRVSRQESRMNDWHCVRWGSTLTLASTPTNPSSIVARIRNFRQCQLGITKILRAIVACIMHTADAQKKKHRTQLYYATWWSVHFF